MPVSPTIFATDEQLASALRSRGQRVTSQRLLIHRTLLELDRHLTAEELLEAVTDRLPGISLPTIYSTLEVFETLGVVRRVAVTQGAVLYDSRAEPHDHRVCDRCGAVEDIGTGLRLDRAIAGAAGDGFSPTRAEVLVHGLCPACGAVEAEG